MNHRLIVFCIGCVFIIGFAIFSILYTPTSKITDTPAFVLAQITDSHSDGSIRTANTNKSVLWIRDQEEIDFVIHTGDLTQHGVVQAEWDEIYQIMHQLDGTQEWSVLAGNHDKLTYFKNTFGDVKNQTKTFGNFAFITMSWDGGEITDGQFDWLDEQLELYLNFTVVIGHHWLHSNASEGHRYNASPSVTSLFCEHLKDYPNVILALSGHNHENDDKAYFQNDTGTYVHFLVSKPVVNTYVRLFYFFSNGSILVKTRDVLNSKYLSGADDQFWITRFSLNEVIITNIESERCVHTKEKSESKLVAYLPVVLVLAGLIFVERTEKP